jgi:hypothetical protein
VAGLREVSARLAERFRPERRKRYGHLQVDKGDCKMTDNTFHGAQKLERARFSSAEKLGI